MEWILTVYLIAPSGITYSFKESFPTERLCDLNELAVIETWDPDEYVYSRCDKSDVILKLTYPDCEESYGDQFLMEWSLSSEPGCTSI